MELVVMWVALGLVLAAVVLVLAGRMLSTGSKNESMWRAFVDDFSSSLKPISLRFSIWGRKFLHIFGGSSNKIVALEKRQAHAKLERRRERDIAKMAVLDDDAHYSNSTLDEFLAATQIDESAYADLDAFSDKIEHMYDVVQERRATAKARR